MVAGGTAALRGWAAMQSRPPSRSLGGRDIGRCAGSQQRLGSQHMRAPRRSWRSSDLSARRPTRSARWHESCAASERVPRIVQRSAVPWPPPEVAGRTRTALPRVSAALDVGRGGASKERPVRVTQDLSEHVCHATLRATLSGQHQESASPCNRPRLVGLPGRCGHGVGLAAVRRVRSPEPTMRKSSGVVRRVRERVEPLESLMFRCRRELAIEGQSSERRASSRLRPYESGRACTVADGAEARGLDPSLLDLPRVLGVK